MRILIADDNRELRSALRVLLRETGMHLILEAADMNEALTAVRQHHGLLGAVDLLLLDWELPAGAFGGDRAAFVAEVKQAAPHCRVIAMSSRPEAQEESLAAGCDLFLSENEPPDVLMELLG